MSTPPTTAIQKLDEISRTRTLDALSQMGPFEQTFSLSRAIMEIRSLITTEMMADVMALQGTALGFRTDRDRDGGYPEAVVKDVLIEATLRGYRPVGNEYNIIGGRFYATKEGLARKVRECPGLANLVLRPTVPKMRDGGAIVEYSATWTMGDVAKSITREIPVRVNAGMGCDAILGKATRKMLATVLGVATGSEHTIPEGEVDDTGVEGVRRVSPSRSPAADVVDAMPAPTSTPEPPQAQKAGPDLGEQLRASVEQQASGKFGQEMAAAMAAAAQGGAQQPQGVQGGPATAPPPQPSDPVAEVMAQIPTGRRYGPKSK